MNYVDNITGNVCLNITYSLLNCSIRDNSLKEVPFVEITNELLVTGFLNWKVNNEVLIPKYCLLTIVSIPAIGNSIHNTNSGEAGLVENQTIAVADSDAPYQHGANHLIQIKYYGLCSQCQSATY